MRSLILATMSVVLAFVSACETSEVNNNYYGNSNEEVMTGNCETINGSTDEDYNLESVDHGGGNGATDFKVPLDPEYNWEVTQSWASHCKTCNNKGYGKNDGSDSDICTWSHSTCAYCKYGLDFSLPGNKDEGKSVLATAEGTVKNTGYSDAWGNYVVIDHGKNVCSRYGHMQNNSVTVKNGDGICQGLIIGKIGDTGSAEGFHLHFQFENCTDSKPIAKSFTDGNGTPMCVIGKDIYDSKGKYKALKLTNKPKESCSILSDFAKKKFNNGANLPLPGIKSVSCGPLPNCPLITTCNSEKNHVFSDDKYLTSSVRNAAQYLYGECALGGKDDGGLHQSDIITNAEGLKIAMYLFGNVSDCGNGSGYVPFSDVKTTDWYYPLVICGLQKGIVDYGALLFWANSSLSFETAAKYLVKSAEKAGVITLKNPSKGSFSKIPSDHPAYKYVETLYAYGAIDTYFTTYYPETSITRGQLIRMAANLSPCYCDNISCDGGCKCDQVNFACAATPSGNDTGGGPVTGGSGSSSPDASSSSDSSTGGSGSCNPSCSGKECGTDGCGGSCGGCGLGFFCNSKNYCQCMPKCSAGQCGSNGCGGMCECSAGYFCNASSQCQKICVPNCSNKTCGSDGCGGTCGLCPIGLSCNASDQCAVPAPTCKPIDCTGILCSPDGCGGVCSNCKNGLKCTAISIPNLPAKYFYFCGLPSK